MEFKGRVAVITGAAVGSGRAAALLMAEKGADVALLDVDENGLKSVEEEIKAYGVKVKAYTCDVSDEARVNEVADDCLKAFGKVDILVNNAALWRHVSSFVETPTEVWRRYFDINVMGVVYCTKAFINNMLDNGYGKIINVSSVAGCYGKSYMAHYSATKAAVINFTSALAKEVTDKGICVNCVSPGSVSPSEDHDIDHHVPSDLCFLGRTGTDRENADLICFLASDKASYISGENIRIDGCRKRL